MKTWLITVGMLVASFFLSLQKVQAQDPITLIIKEGIKKVIVAADLKIQRLQNKTIWLQNAQKTIENTMAQLKLNEITDWVEKQRTLYKDYFNELWQVKNVLVYYHRVKEIIQKQVSLVQQYKSAYALFKTDKHFTASEIDHMSKVYSGILEESLKNLDGLLLVINSFSTQMSDAKRMEIINKAAEGMEQNYADLTSFNRQNAILSLQRAKEQADIEVTRKLYGIK